MADISQALTSMLVLLIVAALGFLAAHLKYLTPDFTNRLAKLVLNITLPCTILSSVGNMNAASAGSQLGWAFGLAALTFPLMLLGGVISVAILRPPRGQRHMYLYMSVFTNIGFIGIAVAQSLFGGSAAFIASIFVAVMNILLYSAGIIILTWGSGSDTSGTGQARKFSADWKSMVNPPLVSSVLALVLFFTGLQPPGIVELTLNTLGPVTAPVAMMIVGAMVYDSNLKDVVGEWRMYGFVLIRFLAFPALVIAAFGLLVPQVDPLSLGVLVVELAMPVGTMAPAIALIYGQDPDLPLKGLILTLLPTFVIVPALVAVMAAFGF